VFNIIEKFTDLISKEENPDELFEDIYSDIDRSIEEYLFEQKGEEKLAKLYRSFLDFEDTLEYREKIISELKNEFEDIYNEIFISYYDSSERLKKNSERMISDLKEEFPNVDESIIYERVHDLQNELLIKNSKNFEDLYDYIINYTFIIFEAALIFAKKGVSIKELDLSELGYYSRKMYCKLSEIYSELYYEGRPKSYKNSNTVTKEEVKQETREREIQEDLGDWYY